MKLHKVFAVTNLRKFSEFKDFKRFLIYVQYLENTESDKYKAWKMHNLLLQFVKSLFISELARWSKFIKPVSVMLSDRLGFLIMLWALI